jgi:CDP-diacylglycerol---glycerol-3-phosphate 3-phosphatidyltransferase
VVFLLIENATTNLWVITLFRWAAFFTFIAAAITDYYDGVIARRENLVTGFGQLFDPVADKLLTMSAFVAFVELRVPGDTPIFPAWAIIIILAREFIVTGLRTLAVAHGRIIAADRLGKHKTAWQLGGIIAILFALCVRDTIILRGTNVNPLDLMLPYAFAFLLFVIVTLTAVSGISYLVDNWDVVSDRE